jgi:hypothetical protein
MTSPNSGDTPFGTVFGLMTFQAMRKAAFQYLQPGVLAYAA